MGASTALQQLTGWAVIASAFAGFVAGGLGHGPLFGKAWMTGATFVSTALAVTYLFEARPLRLWLITAGYQTLNFTLMELILGAWH